MSGNMGSSNRLTYDNCAYQKKLYESTSPFVYQMYDGKFENCGKCKKDKFYRPFDLVDVESELRNISRPSSKCDQFKYTPDCKKSNTCMSTFDASAPVVYVPEICPIVFNNLPKINHPGYKVPVQDFCGNVKPMKSQ
jgi:hypothetical protein